MSDGAEVNVQKPRRGRPPMPKDKVLAEDLHIRATTAEAELFLARATERNETFSVWARRALTIAAHFSQEKPSEVAP